MHRIQLKNEKFLELKNTPQNILANYIILNITLIAAIVNEKKKKCSCLAAVRQSNWRPLINANGMVCVESSNESRRKTLELVFIK